MTALTGRPGLRLRAFDPDSAEESLLTELHAWYLNPATVRLIDGPRASIHPHDRCCACTGI